MLKGKRVGGKKTLVLIKKSYNKEEKTIKKRLKLSESEIIEQRATEKERKRKSRENQQITWSRQKIQGAQLKDKNRKEKLREVRLTQQILKKIIPHHRVQKHRALKVKIDFAKTSKLTNRKEKSLKKKKQQKMQFIKCHPLRKKLN